MEPPATSSPSGPRSRGPSRLPRAEITLLAFLLIELAIQLISAPSPPPYRPGFGGPLPTADPTTWAFVPGDLLLGALVRLDRAPATAFTREQLEELARSTQGDLDRSCDENLVNATAAALTEAQMAAIERNMAALEASPLDPRGLLARLTEQAAGRADPVVPSLRLHGRDFTAPLAVAALEWLDLQDGLALTPGQARYIAPALSAWADDLDRLVQRRRKSAAVLTPPQTEALVALLQGVRTGAIDKSTIELSSAEVVQHFGPRVPGSR